MSITEIPRKAVDTWLRVTRLPLDAGVKLVDGRQPKLGVAVDRLDANVRSVAGRLLRDETLQSDANRLRAAADERVRAVELRAEAEARTEQADEEFTGRVERARRDREQAARNAAEAREAIEDRATKAEQQIAEQASRQKGAAKRAAAQRTKAAADRDKRARLAELERDTEALEESELALVTEQEATRLQKTAAAVKESRKQS